MPMYMAYIPLVHICYVSTNFTGSSIHTHTYINPNLNQRYSCHLFRCVRLPAQPDATAPIIRKISRHLSAPQSPLSHAPRWKWSILFNDDDCNTFIHTYIHTHIHTSLVKEDYNILYTYIYMQTIA